MIAVISYTGYDMEDAMIVNKASYDRGFAHASVRTTVEVNLNKLKTKGEPPHHRFGNLKPPEPPDDAPPTTVPKKFCESLGARAPAVDRLLSHFTNSLLSRLGRKNPPLCCKILPFFL